MSKKKFNIVFETTTAIDPIISGIPQETRLTFDMLVDSKNIEVSSMIFSEVLINKEIPLQTIIRKDHNGLKSRSLKLLIYNSIHKIFELSKSLFLFLIAGIFGIRNIIKLDTSILGNTIWRLLFSESVTDNRQKTLMSKNFYISMYNYQLITLLPRFLLFLYPIAVPKNTNFFVSFGLKTIIPPRKQNTIVVHRFFDTVPINNPDTSCTPAKYYYKIIKNLAAEKSNRFCCISKYTKGNLLKIFPSIPEKNVFVIPPRIPDFKKQSNIPKSFINTIIQKRTNDYWRKKFNINAQIPEDVDYIISVSTIEPRKNYINLIRAWSHYCLYNSKKIKLIIVGSLGWKMKKILAEMAPEISNGNLFHLSNVSSLELQALYTHAKAHVFVSFDEGFGATPIEAMMCECPSLASNIPVHREVQGDASLFCDPYSVEDIAEKIKLILDDSIQGKQLRKELIKKGLEQTKLYYKEALLPKWEKMFRKIQEEKEKKKL